MTTDLNLTEEQKLDLSRELIRRTIEQLDAIGRVVSNEESFTLAVKITQTLKPLVRGYRATEIVACFCGLLSVFINTDSETYAKLLTAFDIKKEVDVDGEPKDGEIVC